MRKFLSIVLCVCMVLGVSTFFVGCNSTDEEIDPDKKQVYVGVTMSGLGRAWIDELDRLYELENPGIQIIVDYKTSEFSSGELKRSMADIRQDVIFTNSFRYMDLIQNPETGTLLEDITDIVVEGGENSIYNSMTNKTDINNYGTLENPTFYTVPYFSSTYGMVYDRDMFEYYELLNLECTDDLSSTSAYKGAKYSGIDGIQGTQDDNAGPDGVTGSYDDGLPGTWEDFKILLDVLVEKGIVPFTFSAKEKGYQNRFLSSIWASYEGKENYELLVELEGDYNGKTITPQNAWELSQQNGKLAALTVAEHLTKGGIDQGKETSKYLSNKTQKGASHSAVNAQVEFINSWPGTLAGYSNAKPIAFLIEGDWWEYEAKDSGTFEDCVAEFGDDKWGYGERNFAYFPFPKFIGTEGIPDQTNMMTTMGSNVSDSSAVAFVNKYSDVKEEAKAFLQFCCTPRANAIFTQQTGMMKPFTYSLSEAQFNSLTPYQQSIWSLSHEENSKVERAVATSRSPLYYYESSFITEAFGFATRITLQDGTTAKMKYPLSEFVTYRTETSLTAITYFENPVAGNAQAGKDKLTSAYWNETLASYFN